ncbi:MAG TPA: hypothetical protein VF771_01565 [Longimicrobiaceae bacterium]
MKKLKLNLDDVLVETFEVRAPGARAKGTVHGRDVSEFYPGDCGLVTNEAVGTCSPFSCGGNTCVDFGCGATDEPSCDYNPCGESVSCTTDVCDASNWEYQCTYDGRGGELCGSYEC